MLLRVLVFLPIVCLFANRTFALETIKPNIYGIDFKFGMPSSDDRFDSLRKAMLEMSVGYGAKITRAGIGWADAEPVRGQPYNWDKGDRKALWLSEHGLPVCLNLMTAPEWATEPDEATLRVFEENKARHLVCGMSIKEQFWNDYEKYITAVAERYGKYVTYYDIWNEPDGMGNPDVYRDENGHPTGVKFGGDPVWYTTLLKHTRPILRKLDPDCVIGGGCLESKNEDTSEFLEGVYKAGGGKYFDAVSMHTYGRPFNFKWVRAVRQVMVANGDAEKPIWITEYGLNWQESDGVSEAATAALVRSALRYMRETPWVTMGLLHHAGPILWKQDPNDPTKLTPRPSLLAFKETADEKGPASTFRSGFEQDTDLTYWYYELDGASAEFPPVTLTKEECHSGKQALRAQTNGKWIEVFGSVNVMLEAPELSFRCKIVPSAAEATCSLGVEVRPGDMSLTAEAIPLLREAPKNKWFSVRIPLASCLPTTAGKTIVDIGIKIETAQPGVTVFLDDITVD